MMMLSYFLMKHLVQHDTPFIFGNRCIALDIGLPVVPKTILELILETKRTRSFNLELGTIFLLALLMETPVPRSDLVCFDFEIMLT